MSALPEGYRFEDDPAKLDRDMIHTFLLQSYWGKGIPRDRMQRAIDNSICIAVFSGSDQIGFARVVTDRAHFAFLADIFVLPTHQRKGIASAMVRKLHDHPELNGLRRWLLTTADAHPLYAQLGYGEPDDLANFMQRRPQDAWG